MRENMGRYRGKRIDSGKWIYGYYAYKSVINKHYILTENTSAHCESYFIEYEVDPETVGEYTRLHDKNGKEPEQ